MKSLTGMHSQYMDVHNTWIYDRVSLERKEHIGSSLPVFRDPIGVPFYGRRGGRIKQMSDTNMYDRARFPAPCAMAVRRIFCVSVAGGEQGGACPDDFRNSWLEFVVMNKIYARLPLPLIWSHRAPPIAALAPLLGSPVPEGHAPANAFTPCMEADSGQVLIEAQTTFYGEIRSSKERTASKAHDFFIVLEGPFARSIQ